MVFFRREVDRNAKNAINARDDTPAHSNISVLDEYGRRDVILWQRCFVFRGDGKQRHKYEARGGLGIRPGDLEL